MAQPQRIAPGAYRVDAVGVPNSISVLLVEGDDGWTLVDSGIGSDASRIREALASLGGASEDLKHVYLTHHHPDHIGGLPGIREWAPGAELISSEGEAEVISGRRPKDPASNPAFAALFRNQKLPTAPIDRTVSEGDVVAGFRVISTPGHTHDHTSLLRDEDGLLFTGDAFGAMVRKIRVGGIKAFCVDPKQARRSAEKLLGEDFDTVVMTHGRPLIAGARRQIRESVARCDY
ncbi:MAG: MBL fold metallo-hydrolase [Actinomycetota bacterium]|nr:MBL fold metallo-hydrolase [Actinomycetota bacterium]